MTLAGGADPVSSTQFDASPRRAADTPGAWNWAALMRPAIMASVGLILAQSGCVDADAEPAKSSEQSPTAVSRAAQPLTDLCATDGLKPGRYRRTAVWEGLERWYEISVPPVAVSGEPMPVVFALHPYVLGGNPLFRKIWRRESGLATLGNEKGYLTIQPDGTGTPASWNGGEECCGDASANDVDDVGFIRYLLERVAEETCIDRSRVYATGMSNGGYLSHRLACEASDFVAAIGPVVGSLSKELVCDLERPVPVIQISGSEDNLESRTASVERWATLNQCTGSPVETYQKGLATCVTWSGCADGVDVTHCVLEGGGHCWFSDLDPQASPGCYPQEDLISQELVWDFVSRYSL